MSAPEPLYVIACAAPNMQPDGTCTAPVWMPYPQQVLPPLSAADGTVVAFAIVSMWALGLKARLIFKAGRAGSY
jgi:hypothetical protein